MERVYAYLVGNEIFARINIIVIKINVCCKCKRFLKKVYTLTATCYRLRACLKSVTVFKN